MHARACSSLLVALSLLPVATLTHAQISSSVLSNAFVTSITFTGSSHLNADVLYSVLRSRTNFSFHPRAIHADIVALISLPQIADVTVTATPSPGGVALYYSIREAPIISALEVTRDITARRIPRRFLRNLQPGLPYSPRALFDATQDIRRYFHAHHYHTMVISGSVMRLSSTNHVRVFLRVHEGPQQFLADIIIHGNHVFSDEAIRNMLHCKERSRWLFRTGAFQPAELARDRERIHQAYLSCGYLDAQVHFSTRMLERSNDVALFIHIMEGPQYTVGRVAWHARGISSNHFEFLQHNMSLRRFTPYTPDLPNVLSTRIAQLSRAEGFPEPSCTIRALLAPESSPRHPVVLLRITLAKQHATSPPVRPFHHQPLMTVISP